MANKAPLLDDLSPLFQYELKDIRLWLNISGYAAGSIDGFSWTIKRLFVWMQQQDYQALDKAILEEYILFLEPKNWLDNTYRITFYGIKKYLQYLFMVHQVNIDVCLPQFSSKYESRPYLSQQQIQQIYCFLDQHPDPIQQSRWRMMMALLYAAGLRISEALALKISDIDAQKCQLWVRKGKGGKSRFVPLPPINIRHIKDYMIHARPMPKADFVAYLMISKVGQIYSRSGINHHLRRLAKANQITPFGPHALRHSIATHLLQQGMSIYQIRDFLGHKSLLSTQVYTHYE